MVKKNTPAKKSAPRKPTKTAKPAPTKSSVEERAAEQALKLVDKAAELLRTGISEGAKGTVAARQKARKEAHTLLGKATDSLSSLLGGTSSVLHKTIDRTLGRN